LPVIQTYKPYLIVSPGTDTPMLLAPRGVALCGDLLAVSDTGQNRIFIWKDYRKSGSEEPDIVLGQSDVSGIARNAGSSVGANTLLYPSGIWTDGKKLIVADAWNHRVLIWHSFPVSNGQQADVVVGQKDFHSNMPNVQGVNAEPTARSLYWCYGVVSDGKSLWIADTGNRRVLFYEIIPTENYAAADNVIGQTNFQERDSEPMNAVWPYSVKLGFNNELAISDTQYFRVLIWKDKQKAFTQPADIIIGQPSFNDNGQNQYKFLPEANTLNWCYDACFFQNGIAVADTGNSRILCWEAIPEQHNLSAQAVIGQKDFSTNGEESLSMRSKKDNEMYWPFSITSVGNTLAIADTGNHRILFYQL
jgi:hypothetical protein